MTLYPLLGARLPQTTTLQIKHIVHDLLSAGPNKMMRNSKNSDLGLHIMKSCVSWSIVLQRTQLMPHPLHVSTATEIHTFLRLPKWQLATYTGYQQNEYRRTSLVCCVRILRASRLLPVTKLFGMYCSSLPHTYMTAQYPWSSTFQQ